MAASALEPRPALHKRTVSYESNSSASSAHKLILEHMLHYPGTYEIPLRTMYSLNSVQRSKATHSDRPASAAQRLETSLMMELSQMSNQPNTLPPTLITSFIRKCFVPELASVDFSQALTGLDYLKQLEDRRTRELKAAMERLGINPDNCDAAEQKLAEHHPYALEWYRGVAEKTHKVERLYSPLFLALRRWILINELSLVPFSKHNCIAMLNTLLPPLIIAPPAPGLTASVLKSQRNVLFKYVQAVEKNGPDVLDQLITHGQRPGEETGWPSVRELLESYLLTCNNMIDECREVVSIHEAAALDSDLDARRKATDSGVDFGTSRKSSTSSDKSVAEIERPASRSHRNTTALERIARELRHLRRSKTDVTEIIPAASDFHGQTSNQPTESKTLRKMKSLGSLGLRRQASRIGLVAPPRDIPDFDVAKMSEQRKAYEASAQSNSG